MLGAVAMVRTENRCPHVLVSSTGAEQRAVDLLGIWLYQQRECVQGTGARGPWGVLQSRLAAASGRLVAVLGPSMPPANLRVSGAPPRVGKWKCWCTPRGLTACAPGASPIWGQRTQAARCPRGCPLLEGGRGRRASAAGLPRLLSGGTETPTLWLATVFVLGMLLKTADPS